MECHHRALGLARPVFNRARTLSAVVVGLVLTLFLANIWIKLVYSPGSEVVNRSGTAIAQGAITEPSVQQMPPEETLPPKNDFKEMSRPIEPEPLEPENVEKVSDSLVTADTEFKQPETNSIPPVLASAEPDGSAASGTPTKPVRKAESKKKAVAKAGIISAIEVVSGDGGLTARILGKGILRKYK